MKFLLRTIIACLLASSVQSARAADLPGQKPTAVYKAPAKTPCSITSCMNKWYIGAGIAGNGTNANIIGNGLGGSVFAGGGIPFVDIGWLSWNGTFLIGAEAGAGYRFNVPGSVNGIGVAESGYMAYQEAMFGGVLSGIFGTQTPINTSFLTADLMTLYVSIGGQENTFASGFRTGAGAIWVLPNSNALLNIGYRYINYGSANLTGNSTINADNLVFAKFDIPLN